MARKYTLHPEVLTRSYKGAVVRFRKVEDDVYMPVKDVRDLLMTGGCSYPIFQICSSSCKIEFYTTGNGITAILPWDIENLAKGGMRRALSANQQERINWLKSMCREIKSIVKPEMELISESQAVVVYQYNGCNISFFNGSNKMMNATQMGVAFNKTPKDWLRTQAAKELIQTLSAVRQICPTDLVVVKQGGVGEQGTWMHEDVAIEFARWLDPQFGIWCNDRIKELLKHGITAMPNVIAQALATPEATIKILQELQAEREAKQLAIEERNQAQSKVLIQTPKVEYYDAVITDRAYFTTTEIASELGTSYATLKKKLYQAGIVSTLTGNLTVNPQYKDYGEIQVRNGIRTRNDFKWNRAGRDAIFELINPEMPK